MAITQFLLFSADLHHAYGLIGAHEHHERSMVAHWLAIPSMADPRRASASPEERDEEPTPGDEGAVEQRTLDPGAKIPSREYPDDLEFIFQKRWHFTGADPDPYPSVPHGHLDSENRRWPKLNPYTGRVYDHVEEQNISLMLTRKQLTLLWGDEKFRDFCLERVKWYKDTYPRYRWRVTDPMILPRYTY